MTEEGKRQSHDCDNAWSARPLVSLRGCGCCCALLGCGCLAVIVALVLCFAAGLLAVSSTIAFISNLLFGAA
jgi:hypothetical protein